jgi:hypothetical protein
MAGPVTLGGARVIRGTTGATRFSILEAPDLSKDNELLAGYGLQDVGDARYVREHLAAMQIGLTRYRLQPGKPQGWAHRHSVAEEAYVALSGSGRIIVDDLSFELSRLDAVRVARASARELQAGPDGLEVLAFGSHYPGDGEMVARSSGRDAIRRRIAAPASIAEQRSLRLPRGLRPSASGGARRPRGPAPNMAASVLMCGLTRGITAGNIDA